MKIRGLAAVAVLAVGALAGTSGAAPKVCNLVVDAKGDGASGGAALDIVSADLASDAKMITGVIRVEKLTLQNPDSPTGQTWYVEWQTPGAAEIWFLSAVVTPTDPGSFSVGYRNAITGTYSGFKGVPATGALDTTKNEIRISTSVNSWGERGTIKKGAKLTGIAANTFLYRGVSIPGVTSAGSLPKADEAVGNKPYVASAKSCVSVGK